jgi:signal transduction histidine kinase
MKVSTTGYEWLVSAVFLGGVLSFGGATGFSQWRAKLIDEAATTIANGTSPRIEHLAAARADLSKLSAATTAYATGQGSSPGETLRELATARLEFGDDIRWLVQNGASSAEARELRDDLDLVDKTADRQAVAKTSLDVLGLIQAEASNSHALANRIERLRTRAARWAYALDVFCALLMLAAAAAVGHALRTRRQLLESYGELQKQRADEMELFSGRVAHDVLNPLNASLLAVAQATRQCDDRDAVNSALARADATLRRAGRVVEGFLSFARAGALPSPDAHSEIALVLEAVYEDVRPLAERAGIELIVPIGSPGAVRCPRDLLASALNNLLWNSVKYMGSASEKRIEIHVVTGADRIRFEVSDTGPGLPPGFGERAFDPFVRGNTHDQPGVGLGLSTVKRIVEAHGGGVGVNSEMGRGCRFWFSLPRAVEAASSLSAVSSEIEPRSQMGR